VSVEGAIALAVIGSGCCCFAASLLIGVAAFLLLRKQRADVAKAPAPIVEHAIPPREPVPRKEPVFAERAPTRPPVVAMPPVATAPPVVAPPPVAPPPPVVAAPPIVPPVVVAPPVVDATKAVIVEEVDAPRMVEATKAVVEEASDAPLLSAPQIDTGTSLPPDRPFESDAFSSQTMIPIPNLADIPPGGATIMVPAPVPIEGPDPAADAPEAPKLGRRPTIVPDDAPPTEPRDEE
jgi:hypothetical protein